MTQPDKPAPAKGARPQLFGDPRASKSRHADFGPSILATIDGNPRRDARSLGAAPLMRVLWMSVLALAAVAVYFGVKFGMLPTASPMPASEVTAPVAAKPVVVAEVAKPPLALEAVAAPGVAAIENVAPPPVVAAAESSTSATTSAAYAATSLNNVQQTLASSGADESHEPARAVVPSKDTSVNKSATPPREMRTPDAAPALPARSTAPSPKAGKSSNDSDAELIAAMLPYLKRRGLGPTSPAYEKRCGQFTGDAAAECWAKFCNGREGVDAACPVPTR